MKTKNNEWQSAASAVPEPENRRDDRNRRWPNSYTGGSDMPQLLLQRWSPNTMARSDRKTKGMPLRAPCNIIHDITITFSLGIDYDIFTYLQKYSMNYYTIPPSTLENSHKSSHAIIDE